MKVYVVIGGWEYEGYSNPVGVYSTKELAEVAVKKAGEDHSYDTIEIMEYTVDEPEDF